MKASNYTDDDQLEAEKFWPMLHALVRKSDANTDDLNDLISEFDDVKHVIQSQIEEDKERAEMFSLAKLILSCD